MLGSWKSDQIYVKAHYFINEVSLCRKVLIDAFEEGDVKPHCKICEKVKAGLEKWEMKTPS